MSEVDESDRALLERLKLLMYHAIDENDRRLVDMDTVGAETELATLPLDSLATVELLYEIEQAFAVNIPETAAFDFATVGDVVAYIGVQRAAAAH